jgi:xanthine dehydrogenase accessory factor
MMPRASLGRLRELIESDVPVVMATVIRGDGLGQRLIVLEDGVEGSIGDDDLDHAVAEVARDLLAAERSESREIHGREVFFDVHPQPQHLVIFGAVHVAQPLSRYAQDLGFRVTVVDARTALATEERFPNVERLIRAWPDAAYEQMKIGRNTWIAILSHDPKFDEPAILGALKTGARYIGTVGSRKTNADRRERLLEAGVSDDDLSRLHGPIGLNIGGKTPEEMAISILAEMIAIRNGRDGGMLRDASGSIRGEGR